MNKREISIFKTAVSFAGCFLGAGYVSGQELYQFFFSFGKWGIVGLFAAILLVVLFGIIVFKIVQKTGELQVDKVICGNGFFVLRKVIAFLEIFFLFGIFVIMASGAGALLGDMLGVDYYIATAVFCLVSVPAVLMGVTGMVSIFSAVVPLLCIFVCVVAAYALKNTQPVYLDALKTADTNALLNNWTFSSVTYVSYNMFAAIPIIIPLAAVSKQSKATRISCIWGGIILFAVALSIWILMASSPECAKYELPVVEMLKSVSPVISVLYGVMLMCAMFSAGVSSLISVNEYIADKYLKNRKNKYVLCIFTIITAVLAWLLSLVGFANLVGTVYPVCGYFGFIVLVFLVKKALVMREKNKQ